MKRYIVTCIIVLIFGGMLYSKDAAPEVTLSAHYTILKPKPTDSDRTIVYPVEYILHIVNPTETAIRLPTRNFRLSASGDRNSCSTVLIWERERDRDGRTVVRPSCDYGFVELRAMECVDLEWTDTEFRLEPLTNIHVTLSVSAEFSSRYDCWGGAISVSGRASPQHNEGEP